MGQFTSTLYTNTIENVINGYKNRINQASLYTRFINQNPTPVTYFNINTIASSLDVSTHQQYDLLTDEDPLRYNRINGFYLYGIGRIETTTNVQEFGPESNIEGEAIILPNTIIPLEGDYFTIDYLMNDDKKILFRVLSSDRDTLENGTNFYKVRYKLDQTLPEFYEQLLRQTIKTFKFIPSNVGTNMVSLLEEQIELSANKLLSIVTQLKEYYIDLFYKRNVQTFVYPYETLLIYDPYIMEFFIRNSLFMLYEESYLYLSQATFRSSTFSIEYAKTIFLNIEQRNNHLNLNTAWPIDICDVNSLLIDRMEEYLELSVKRKSFDFHTPINILDMDLFDRIVTNSPYNENDISLPLYRNIIINFMNGKDFTSITDAQLESLDNIQYARTKIIFYELAIIIYILNTYITDILSDTTKTAESCEICGKESYVNGK